jgi:hypothetical protein
MFGSRFGRSEYGIFDVFRDEAGRDPHLPRGCKSTYEPTV